MDFAFVEAAEAVSAQSLHDANVDVRIVVAKEGFAVDRDVGFESAKILVEKVLAKIGREIRLGVEEQRSDVVLQGTFAAALVVDKMGLATAKQDVARLKVTIEEKIA